MASSPLTRLGAQGDARHELAKRPYQQAKPPWWLRPLQWVFREIAKLWLSVANHTGGSAALSVIIVGALVILALIAWRVGPLARGGRSRFALGLEPESTATDHRAAAERFAAQQRWAEAVRERLRAISRDLEERVLVNRRPGRTAYELAAEGGRALPANAAMLREAADRFAAIWYGSASAGAEDYRRLKEIDLAVQAARPARTAEPLPGLVAP